ncbi:MAG: hypothetical protein K6E85_01470 [Lachnospiraceae bacterium]|nr:hypothetical protein [Lachnospiraceae bacterium]
MKKMTAFGTVIAVLILLAFPTGSYANELETPAPEPIIEEYSDMNSPSCNLNIANGEAEVTASAHGKASVIMCEIVLEIQEQFGPFWITKCTWSDSKSGRNLSLVGNYSVTSGKTYRAKAWVTVYTASGSESATVTSASQTAN